MNCKINNSETKRKPFKNMHNIESVHKTKTKKKEVIVMNMNDQEFIVQKIRTQYTEKEQTGLDELKALDGRVKRPAHVFAYIYGSISALVMGSGMSLTMTDIGQTIGMENPMIPGIVIGILGMLMAVLTYPLYKKILGSRRKKYADQIVSLSDKIMKKQ